MCIFSLIVHFSEASALAPVLSSGKWVPASWVSSSELRGNSTNWMVYPLQMSEFQLQRPLQQTSKFYSFHPPSFFPSSKDDSYFWQMLSPWYFDVFFFFCLFSCLVNNCILNYNFLSYIISIKMTGVLCTMIGPWLIGNRSGPRKQTFTGVPEERFLERQEVNFPNQL